MNNSRKKPAEGFQMINVDASCDAVAGVGSIGAVIRDATGGFIAASYSYIPHVVDATMAEVFAQRDGLLLAQQIGCNRVEV
jgi:ribonuclease HI